MNPFLLAAAALAALSSLACCSAQEPRAPASREAAPAAAAPEHGKLEAPVEIAAELGDGTARVTVRFGSAATGVRVGVSGVDGLVVKGSPTLVDGATYDRGAVAAFDVAFTPGPVGSHLAVVVSGSFGGGHRAMVRSFATGAAAPGQEKARLEETPGGDRVKIVVPGR